MATERLICGEDPQSEAQGQKFSSQLCHTLQEDFQLKSEPVKIPEALKLGLASKVSAGCQLQTLGRASPEQCGCWPHVAQEGVGSAPAPHAPTAASLRSLLRSECHCSPHTPQQLCCCWRVNKPAPAVPVLFTPAPWACSGWRDGTGGLCCVSSSLERRSKPFITKLPFLPVLNGVLFYFFSCQRDVRLDFVIQILGHHLGLGSPGSLIWYKSHWINTDRAWSTGTKLQAPLTASQHTAKSL